MALVVDRSAPIEGSVGTTLTALTITEPTITAVQISTDVALYLVHSDTLTDGGTVPAAARFTIPAGVVMVVPVRKTVLVAAVSGTAVVGVLVPWGI